jgi:hypothetical protein
MHTLHLAATDTTPEVLFDPEHHRLELRGHCQPHRADVLFNPLLLLLRRHFSQRQPQFFLVQLDLEYLDKGSVPALRELLALLDVEGRKGRWIEVVWTCPAGDEVQAELGRMLAHGLPNIEFECDMPAAT